MMPVARVAISRASARAKPAVMRARMDLSPIVGAQAETHTADRVDEGRVVALIYLVAEVADVHVQNVVVAAKVVLPDVLEDLGAGEDMAGVPHQQLQQGVLRAGEID